jgi:threonine dehydrogenase-like Zn-dependent dehydrogenase
MNSINARIFELTGARQLVLKAEPLEEPGPGQVQAETIVSAISPGTEAAAYRGANPLKPGRVYPRLMGYCNVAKVIQTGEGVSGIESGDHILTWQSHRTAFTCPADDFMIRLPKMDLRHAATAYLYHLGLHGLITAGTRFGHQVGVVGIGTLGYTTCIMSQLSGANTFAFTNQAGSVQNLQKYRVKCFSKDPGHMNTLKDLTHGTGLDIVINTSNNWDDFQFALQLVNKGGTIVNIGHPGRDQPVPSFNPLDSNYVYVKNITIRALCHLNESDVPPHEFRFSMKRNMQHILDLMQDGRLNPDEIISDEIPFTELGDQYEKYLNRNATLYTTILNWK